MDILKKIEKEGRKGFNWWVLHETRQAQKKYGFDMTKHEYAASDTHNNESDAFKHAFLSRFLSYYINDSEAKRLGDINPSLIVVQLLDSNRCQTNKSTLMIIKQ